MSRRSTQLFNLSLLDLLTSALGAIIFLFIITPKGGQTAANVQQAVVYFDTIQMKIHGELPDSLLLKETGDTLFTVLVDYRDYPKNEPKKDPVFAFRSPKPVPSPVKEEVKKPAPSKASKPELPAEPKEDKPTPPKKEPPVKQEKKEDKTPAPKEPTYKGDAPSVPCAVSVEITWADKENNVDLFVCKNGDCVYGNRKRDRSIGQWDSGKSRNRVFGNDLRTTQEAVRQFDRIIPGEYKIYAKYKSAKQGQQIITIKGLIYTKDKSNKERGEAFTKKLRIGKERVLIGTLKLDANGNYQFKRV